MAKTAPKMSRNKQRKAAYAAKANGGSRNQNMLDGPIVGKFVEKIETKPCPRCFSVDYDAFHDPTSCSLCHGDGRVPVVDATGRPRTVKVIDHNAKRTVIDDPTGIGEC